MLILEKRKPWAVVGCVGDHPIVEDPSLYSLGLTQVGDLEFRTPMGGTLKLARVKPHGVRVTLNDRGMLVHESSVADAAAELIALHELAPKIKKDRIDELTYKQVISQIDNNFLDQKVRADALEGIQLSSIDIQDNLDFTFMVRSSEHAKNNVVYANTIRIIKDQWQDIIDDESLSPIERSRLLMYDGQVQLNCTCPSFLYWGYRYILARQGASIFPETRPPVERNPRQRGIVCKHMHKVIKAYPFYTGNFAKFIKREFAVSQGNDKDWDVKTKVADIFKKNPEIEVDYRDVTGKDDDEE